MKKILFAALLMITSIAAFPQQKPVLHNQFSDYVQFRKDHQRPEFNRHHRPEFGPQHFPMQPKPLSVTVKGDKVIVIFKKEDFQMLRPMVRDRVMWRERPRGRVQEMLIEKMEH
jgi:hypothetical protein